MVYSLDERKVGKFFDEDLYEKTVIINLSEGSTDIDNDTYYFDESVKQIVDADVFISASDFSYDADNADSVYKLNVTTSPPAHTNYYFNNKYDDGEETANASITFTDYSNYNYAMVKVQYTKV